MRWLVCAVRSCAGACGERKRDTRLSMWEWREVGRRLANDNAECWQRQRGPAAVGHGWMAVEVWKPPLMWCGVERTLRGASSRARWTQVAARNGHSTSRRGSLTIVSSRSDTMIGDAIHLIVAHSRSSQVISQESERPCKIGVHFTLDSMESLIVQHEQSFADMFNAFMRYRALEYGCRFHSFSLDGQDRDMGADYVLTDSDRFAMVEFKYSQGDLVSEKCKPRRLTLCQQLLHRDDMRALHDRCHFISWTEGDSRAVKTNIYRNEICTQAVFGSACGLPALNPTSATRAPASGFAKDFFGKNGGKSLSLAEFESYVAWVLTKTSAATSSTIELVAHNPTSSDLALIRLNSIAEAQQWVQAHVKLPPPRNSYGNGYEI
ncbi:hypothetical protein BgramDRAFT_1904 [Paraburkholderia graminis C4D1M]|uniref:Uncharacterized protein n=2 Tax=Paraburkholderia graminis TaxID=60548 RepID=B1FY61_PARG4|nr:hypothetical protein BgramDRAFT_1904 [Paraburkholderia graminis C4D1M]